MASQTSALGWVYLHSALVAQIGLLCVLLTLPLALLAYTRAGRTAILVLGPLLFTSFHIFVYIDRMTYAMFRFHINGLAYNVLTTPGGFDSLRLSQGDFVLFAVVCIGGLAAEFWLLRGLLRRADEIAAVGARLPRSRLIAVAAAALVVCILADKAIYASADLRGVDSITRLARAIPLYQPLTVKRLAHRFVNIEPVERAKVDIIGHPSSLAYPSHPLEFREPDQRPNILWIILDSWRFDAFTPEVTPNIWEFSRRAQVFENHLATGNATRFGVFGMFYGLHGSYWHHMLAEQRGPVLMSRLKELGYGFKIITPSPLTFPEFRRTVFVELRDRLDDNMPGETLLERHVETVEMFESFAASEDAQNPFFSFIFFDSSHAPYDFPPDHAPFKPYIEAVSYSSMSRLAAKRDQIINRYWNSLHYLDLLTERVLDALRSNGLLENTIILIAGDHGDEFNEHGFWGHNSAFTREQIHVPLILFLPDREPRRIPWVTSNQDLVPTFMPLLGTTNPAEHYSNGQSLFDPVRRTRIVACGWDECSWISDDGHIIFGTQTHRAWGLDILSHDYKPHPEAEDVLARRSPELGSLARDLSAFLKR